MPNSRQSKGLTLGTPATYRIRVEGCLNGSLINRLGGIRIDTRAGGDQTTVTTLVGRVKDQAELTGVFNSLYELHLPILSVENLTENKGGSEGGQDAEKSSQ